MQFLGCALTLLGVAAAIPNNLQLRDGQESYQIVVPEDAADGYYAVTQNDSGEWEHRLVHDIAAENVTSPHVSSRAAGGPETSGKTSGFNCNSPVVWGDESGWETAVAFYGNKFQASGGTWCFNWKADYIVAGNYVVFACNYYTSLPVCRNVVQFDQDQTVLLNNCRQRAGWVSHPYNTVGRSLKGLPIC